MPPRRLLLIGALAAAAVALAAWGGALAGLLPTRALAVGLAPRRDEDVPAVDRLREEVARLSGENALLKVRLGEYSEIRELGGVPPQQAVVVRARVLERSVLGSRRYVFLDAGAADGVETGMAVCSGWTLVGVVVGLREGRSLVQLVTDSASSIPAVIVAGDQLVCEGAAAGTGARTWLDLRFVEDRDGLRIEPDMPVVTAGGSGRLPAGLVLGRIKTAVRPGPGGGPHWRIGVAPLRTADDVESLLIIRFVTPPPEPRRPPVMPPQPPLPPSQPLGAEPPPEG